MKVYAYHIHNHPKPWDGAPLWAIELAVLLLEMEKTMATAAETKAAVDKLATAVDALIAKSTGGVNPADLDPVVAQINAETDKVVAATPQ